MDPESLCTSSISHSDVHVGEEDKSPADLDGSITSSYSVPCTSRSTSPVFFAGPASHHIHAAMNSNYSSKDIRDPAAVHGSCGLFNLGNTCFMNAGIQSLASCAPLVKFFFEKFQLTDNLKGTLTGAFYILLCKIWSGEYSLVDPRQFQQLLGLYHPQFQDYRQHDCQEFLALLLDTLHEQLNHVPDSNASDSSSDKNSPELESLCPNQLNNQDACDESVVAGINQLEESVKSRIAGAILVSDSVGKDVLDEKESFESNSSKALEEEGNHFSSADNVHLKPSLKRAPTSSSDALVITLMSEDSNHSSVSIHSTDSEQSSAFKKLKIESESAILSSSTAAEKPCLGNVQGFQHIPASKNCSHLTLNSVSCTSTPGLAHARGEALSENMVMLSDTSSCLVQDKHEVTEAGLLGGDLEVVNMETSVNKSDHSPSDFIRVQPAEDALGSLPCLEDYYCKETKTLNTNVLATSYLQNDITLDSEKFAKVDNRCQVPSTKEVNLLQEALDGVEEDKVDKILIGKNLGKNGSLTSASGSNIKISKDRTNLRNSSSNLRMVKTRNSAILRKPVVDPNLLNNSYDFDDETLACAGLVTTSLQKNLSETDVGLACSKADAELPSPLAEKMELNAVLKPSEVEKNVQMQAYSKFNTAVAKSNIREDISDTTSYSTETEDVDMEVESSEDENNDDEEDEDEDTVTHCNVAEEGRALPNPARCYTAADVATASSSWERYKQQNNSIIVDSFQGQFKSTVVCSHCEHVSVTYEPFMYLSLPIPHAMERQLCVLFIRPGKPSIRYMLTLHKNNKVQHLRKELQSLTRTETSEVILAEVLNNHVSRLLDDNFLVRYVNDTTRSIHAFEMIPAVDISRQDNGLPRLLNSLSSVDHCNIPSTLPSEISPITTTCDTPPSNLPLSVNPSVVDYVPAEHLSLRRNAQKLKNVFEVSTEETLSTASSSTSLIPSLGFTSLADQSGLVNSGLTRNGFWEWNNQNELDSKSFPETQSGLHPVSSVKDAHINIHSGCCGEGGLAVRNSSVEIDMGFFPAGSDFASHEIWSEKEMAGGEKCPCSTNPSAAGDVGLGSGLGDQWRTCAICLEELMDSELLTHVSCTGVFCHNCLEMSAKHSGDLSQCCPICLAPADMTQDFIPLASHATVKSKVRILAVPVTFRHESQCSEGISSELQLVCGPRVVYLASKQNATTLFGQIDKVAPLAAPYKLFYTDGQGFRCSRCDYVAHCSGCEVVREGEVLLQPGDNLTVHFTDVVPLENMKEANKVSEDTSMQKLRNRQPISIFDCFDAFTQSEVLDEHNPWYCPCCRCNQSAKKTMSVWSYPDTLIIHLKRFVFEDLSSTKIDNRVVFPHTNLDVTPFLSGPAVSFNVYDLHSIICHYGGVNSGHYTAFTCHPLTNEWYHYNDEMVTQQKPGDGEFDSGYVLMYRRQGKAVNFLLVQDISSILEENVEPTFSSYSSLTFAPYSSHQSQSPATNNNQQVESIDEDHGSNSRSQLTDLTDVAQKYDFYN